ncbi:peptidase C15 [Trichoderma sp. SZMC 28013]
MVSPSTLNVVVTGNPPFMEYDYNTSQLVRDALPHIITRSNQKDIRIFKYFRDTLDTYDDVRYVSRDIWSGKRSLFLPKPEPNDKEEHIDVDFILHLGMIALGWDSNQFRFETTARRDGYNLSGDDGKLVDSEQLRQLGLPETLSTSLDVKAAWIKILWDTDAREDVTSCVSEDAGLYFCEFRLYSSLAEPLLCKEFDDKKGRVVFQHLPQAHDLKAIELARDITITYIASLADDPIFNTDWV